MKAHPLTKSLRHDITEILLKVALNTITPFSNKTKTQRSMCCTSLFANAYNIHII